MRDIVSLTDKESNVKYFMIWDITNNQPLSVGSDLLTILALSIKIEPWTELDIFQKNWSTIKISGSTYEDFDEMTFFNQFSISIYSLLEENCIIPDKYNNENNRLLNTFFKKDESDIKIVELFSMIKDFNLQYKKGAYFSNQKKHKFLSELIVESGAAEELLCDILPDLTKDLAFIFKLLKYLDASEVESFVDISYFSSDDIKKLLSFNGGEIFLKYIDKSYLNDKFKREIISKNGALLNHFPEFINDKNTLITAFNSIKYNTDAIKLFQNISENLKSDRDIVLIALSKSESIYSLLNENLQKDFEIASLALETGWLIFDKLHPTIKKNHEIINLYENLKETDLPF